MCKSDGAPKRRIVERNGQYARVDLRTKSFELRHDKSDLDGRRSCVTLTYFMRHRSKQLQYVIKLIDLWKLTFSLRYGLGR